MKKKLFLLCCLLPLLTSCSTFKEYISPEHPYIMLAFGIAILAFWVGVFSLLLKFAGLIVREILLFFLPFGIHNR